MRVDFALGITDFDDTFINKGLSKGFTSWHPEMHNMVRDLEAEFFYDMDRLNVRRPDAVLRVTEHIQEVVDYVSTLINQGNAYVTHDGVYFSMASMKHRHDKFRPLPTPEVTGDVDSDGGDRGHAKKDPRDFALWKLVRSSDSNSSSSTGCSSDSSSSSSSNSSRSGGSSSGSGSNVSSNNSSSNSDSITTKGMRSKDCISWPSPWGQGRPGWHIECSAMTHSYFGDHIDMHSGGIDLQFPHHTNEIAQCEAHNCADHHSHTSDWVSVWLHTGHLHIKGRKMSKSLKNFISIQEYMDNTWRENVNVDSTSAGTARPPSPHAADDFRLFCLQHKYHSPLSFSEERIHEAAAYRHKVVHFMDVSNHLLTSAMKEEGEKGTNPTPMYPSRKPTTESVRLQKSLLKAKEAISIALSDDFDTPCVLRVLTGLMSEGTRFVNHCNTIESNSGSSGDGSSGSTTISITMPPLEPLASACTLVGSTLHMLGLQFCPVKIDPLSAHTGMSSSGTSSVSVSPESSDTASQAINAMVDYRSKVRVETIEVKKALKKALKAAKAVNKRILKGTVAEPVPVGEENCKESPLTAVDERVDKMLGLCDDARRDWGQQFNIRIDDTASGDSRWKPSD
jgi:cysteinyl-tRNA synthetase